MKKKIILASHNASKLKEFREIFADSNYEIVSLTELAFHDEIEETGTTFQENALIKAQTIYNLFKIPVLADDSGLSVNELDGFPGVQSARFMHDSPQSEKNLALIAMLEGKSNRGAKFVASIALVGLSEHPQVFSGEVKGVITKEEQGQTGFGYDPIFLIPKLGQTMAELPASIKNEISHRGEAMKLLFAYLKQQAL